MILGFDVSNFSGDPEYHAVRALVTSMDIRRITIACQFPATYAPWYDVAKQLGLSIYAYQFPYTEQPETEYVVEALSTFQAHGWPEALFLDYEEQSPTPTVSTESALMQVPASILAGVYTRPDWWLAHGNYQLGGKVPLWNAGYSGDDTKIDPVNYGGWLRARGQQYNGSFQSYGYNVCLDVWRY